MIIPTVVPLTRIKHSEDCAILHGYPCNCDRKQLATAQSVVVAWATIATIGSLALAAVALR